ncbi:hypothetical protein FPCIR_10816 [Fusarium pseudocircinatum]|uniref:Uncharacterized protein n=1 Tax=Fusarium pseudocircinatum TaxID=56676 RepID=A0A8H5KWI7_9HYPO|nr:hypothetical protein FPCIR_10816 [Fusarium pseudocircinatum]
MTSEAVDLTGASPPTGGIPPPLVKLEQALLLAAVPQAQASEQNSYLLYQKECRLAWIKYLGLLGRIRLREGVDGLPFFHGMPPQHQTQQVVTERLAEIQKAAAIENFTKDRDVIKRWEALGSRNPMHLLNHAQASPEQATAYKEIQPSMFRLVGIRTNKEDPASCPGYVLSMASFERSVWKGEKASNEMERRQCADMALRSLQKFMDAQKNEEVIHKMVGFQKHYEALAALSSK